jgi:hypothetical protein
MSGAENAIRMHWQLVLTAIRRCEKWLGSTYKKAVLELQHGLGGQRVSA